MVTVQPGGRGCSVIKRGTHGDGLHGQNKPYHAPNHCSYASRDAPIREKLPKVETCNVHQWTQWRQPQSSRSLKGRPWIPCLWATQVVVNKRTAGRSAGLHQKLLKQEAKHGKPGIARNTKQTSGKKQGCGYKSHSIGTAAGGLI